MPTDAHSLVHQILDNALSLHAQTQPLLDGKEPISNKDVRTIRVTSKHLRACWQLLNPLLKNTVADDAKRDLKKASATLQNARELHVMANTLARLVQKSRSKDAKRILTTGHALLFANIADNSLQTERPATLRETFEQDALRWRQLDVKFSNTQIRRRGYGRLYAKAYKFANAAHDNSDVEMWHRARKWVKYLSYTLPWLELSDDFSPDPADFTAFAKSLGKLHDLHRLIAYSTKHRATFANKDDAAYFIHQLQTAESHLQWRCEKSSRNLFLLSPTQFEKAAAS